MNGPYDVDLKSYRLDVAVSLPTAEEAIGGLPGAFQSYAGLGTPAGVLTPPAGEVHMMIAVSGAELVEADVITTDHVSASQLAALTKLSLKLSP